MNGRPVLKAGLKWSIGDGHQASIWHSNWIPDCPQYMVQKPQDCVFEVVADLIDTNTNTRNIAALHARFAPAVAHKIQCIPLSRRNMVDWLSWSLEKRGFYTVKTAYWIARAKIMNSVLTSTSSGDPYKDLWQKIWAAKVPGKVQIHIWKACSNILPTRANLLTKGYTGDTECLICQGPYEDTAHILCKCPTATAALATPPLSLQNSLLLPNIVFKEWMFGQATHLQKDRFAQLLMVLCAIWKNRNDALWNNKTQSAQSLIIGAVEWWKEYQEVRRVQQKPKSPAKQHWQPDEFGKWKLNVDGSFVPSTPQGSVGGVLRDQHVL